MSTQDKGEAMGQLAPGDELPEDSGISAGVKGYIVGLVFSLLLTAASFTVVHSTYLWTSGIPVALGVLAVAQMGIHLVFFLHINSGPDNTNNILALGFGLMVVVIVISGSLWIMGHLSSNMMPMEKVLDIHQQR